MLIKEKRTSNVSLFFSSEQNIFAAINRQFVDLKNNTTLTEFANTILSITSNDLETYVLDVQGNCKKIYNNIVESFEKSAVKVFSNSQVIAHLENPNRTGLLNAQGNLIWELDFRSLDFVYDENLIFVEDSRDDENSKILAVSLTSGNIIWSRSIQELGEEFAFFIGVDNSNLYLVAEDPLSINVLRKETGELIRKIDVTNVGNADVNLELFQLDISQNQLISPIGEINLTNYQFTSNNLDSYHPDLSIPEVSPFIFNDTHIFFGIQKHIDAQTDHYKVISELLVLDRASNNIVYAEKINDEREGVTIEQISLSENKLYVLDDSETLTTYTL